MKIPIMLGLLLFALIPAQAQAPYNSPLARNYVEQLKSPAIPLETITMPLEREELPIRDKIRLAAEKYGISYKWLLNVLGPLKLQINEHKMILEKRTASLMEVDQNADLLKKNMASVESEYAILQNQGAKLDQLLLVLMKSAKPSTPNMPEKPVAVAV